MSNQRRESNKEMNNGPSRSAAIDGIASPSVADASERSTTTSLRARESEACAWSAHSSCAVLA